MQKHYIETTQQLESFCKLIADSQWLTVDTEFLRESTYYPKFCLLQVANGEHAACIDPLTIEDLSSIKALLLSPDITKVFHAAFQDMEIFYHLWDAVPAPIFDTQLAATITGHGDQMGYGRLVQKLLNTNLQKDQARTDWSLRPLDQRQLDYALDDVIYLADIYLILNKTLSETGRSDWLTEEYAEFEDPQTYQVHARDAWQKVKGRQHLKGVQLAVLQQLSAWREERAIAADKPRRWILKDEVLVDLSKRMPDKIQQLQRIRGLEKATISKQGNNLLDIIQKAKATPREQWPSEKNKIIKLSAEQEAITDLLMCSLRLICAEQDITPAAIASRKDLEKMASGIEDTPMMQGWRFKIAGQQLKQVSRHKLLPLWNSKGQLSLQHIE